MSIGKFGQWDAARMAVESMGLRASRAMNSANGAEAHMFRALVVRAFNSRGKSNGTAWPKLQKSTIKRKGSSKPLVDHGDLRNSIVVVDKGHEAFVGVLSSKRGRTGKPLVKVGDTHENGKVIVQKRGDKAVVIKIPKRSFLKATADKHFKPSVVKTRFLARVAIAMGNGWAVQAPAKAATLAKAGIAEAKTKVPVKRPRKRARKRSAGGRFA